MLLTLSAPAKRDFGYKPPHDHSPPFPLSSTRFSPKAERRSLPSIAAAGTAETMTQPHRGLPPPAAMTLPDPNRGAPPLSQSMGPVSGQMPAPPSQWQGAEESMRNWLTAKAEEDKRKQEEEKTRQESLKLEQRKIEQSMLRDSIQGGVPPHMVPVIFAGIGGGNLTNLTLDWLQQYMAQIQATQQQQQQQQQQQHLSQTQASSDLRRESRVVSQPPPSAYGVPSQLGQGSNFPPSTSLPSHHHSFSGPSYSLGQLSPSSRARPSISGPPGPPHSGPRHSIHTALPRLTTNEMQIHPPPSAPSGPPQMQQQSQAAQPAQQDQQSSSPSIYFHHWVPPSTQSASGANQPATPSAEYTNSPKKRKAQGPHQPAPAPSSGPQFTSPSFSHASSSSSTSGRRGTHTRTRSDTSARGLDGTGRPSSRRGTISSTHTEGIGPSAEASLSQHDSSHHQQRRQQRSQSSGDDGNEDGGRRQRQRADQPSNPAGGAS